MPGTRLRFALGCLLAFSALNAFGGGCYGMSGAKGVPTEWLAGSPFRDYFVPSLILFVVVGGSALAGSIMVFARSRHARVGAFASGVILIGWIIAQLAIIGSVSWLQPAMLVTGIAIIATASRLPRA